MNNIQFVSDLHLELLKSMDELNLIPVSKNLVLAGDIGYPGTPIYTEFLYYCSTYFENVFVIFGNHEYYNSYSSIRKETMEDRRSYMKNIPDNIYFLDNSCVYINKITNQVFHNISNFINKSDYIKIIGSTLWSNIIKSISHNMNDYKCIYKNKNQLITSDDTKIMFNDNVKYISNEIDKDPEINCILITHHAIHPICYNHDYPNTYYTAYISNIPQFYAKKNLKISISGHTHKSIDTNITFNLGTSYENTIRFVSNQYGYETQRNKTNYKNNKIVEFV